MSNDTKIVQKAFRDALAVQRELKAFEAQFYADHQAEWDVEYAEEMDMYTDRLQDSIAHYGEVIFQHGSTTTIAEMLLYDDIFTAEASLVNRDGPFSLEEKAYQLMRVAYHDFSGPYGGLIPNSGLSDEEFDKLTSRPRVEPHLRRLEKATLNTSDLNASIERISELARDTRLDIVQTRINQQTADKRYIIQGEVGLASLEQQEARFVSAIGEKLEQALSISKQLEPSHAAQLVVLAENFSQRKHLDLAKKLSVAVNNPESVERSAKYNEAFDAIEAEKERQMTDMFVAKEITDAHISNLQQERAESILELLDKGLELALESGNPYTLTDEFKGKLEASVQKVQDAMEAKEQPKVTQGISSQRKRTM